MKKHFLIISVAFFSLATLGACKKCKDCTCEQTISQTGQPDTQQSATYSDVCDDDLDDVEGTQTYTQTVGGFTQTVTQTCDCK